MPEHEGRNPAFYDHETEEPRTTGRRRRQVADWGVGEDVFDRMPSRRFGRRGEEHRQVARQDEPADGRFARRDGTAARRADADDLAERDEERFARRGAEFAVGDDERVARRGADFAVGDEERFARRSDDLAAYQEEPA